MKINAFGSIVIVLTFSIFEFVGGILTGSVAILSDAVHDVGDAASIGISYFLEKKSKHSPDKRHTYGYTRYSVLGSLITVLILIGGSVAVVYNAIMRIISPVEINYNGMILMALFGVLVNFAAAFFTRGGGSLNQKAVNLHMLEDVLGWLVVLIGAVVMRFTNLWLIDPIMSIGVAIFIFINACRTLAEALDVFLEKAPQEIDVSEIKNHLKEIEGILDVHHVHVWTMDGSSVFATMHVVTSADAHTVKEQIRGELREHGIHHVTLELESEGEHCHEHECKRQITSHGAHCHHHHGHHHH